MKFYTRKGKRIYCASMSAFGIAMIVGIIVFFAAGSVYKAERRFTNSEEVGRIVGEGPQAADYQGGYQSDEYKTAMAEHESEIEAERQKQQAVINGELSALFRKKMSATAGIAFAAAVLSGIVFYRDMVSVIEIEDKTIRLISVSGKNKELDIARNHVVFSTGRVISRSALYIPQYVCQLNYTTFHGSRERSCAEVVYLNKKDGTAVADYFASI